MLIEPRRLILFSGGVESTALLSLKQPNDVVFVVDELSSNYGPSFNRAAVQWISAHYPVAVEYATIDIGFRAFDMPFLYSFWGIMAAVGLRCARDMSIKEVWYGMHNGEPYSRMRPQFDRIVDGFKVTHPDVEFKSPLYHLTKEQQWKDHIPDRIKPYVRNCVYTEACGKCLKCKELQKLPGSFWNCS